MMSSPIRDFRHAGDLAPQPFEVRESSLRNEARAAAHDFSLVLGGPVYDFLQRIGLVRLGLPNTFRRVVAIIVITWVPLLLLSIKDGLVVGNRIQIPLLLDYSVYGRLLLGLPLLLLAEVVIDPAIRSAIKEFVDAKLIQAKELPEFEKVLHRAQKLRDSVIPELVLLLLAFFPVFLFRHEWQAGAVSSWHSTAKGLTAAGWWYAAVSAPFIRFFLYRWAFRYFVWTLLLWKLSRTPLHLIPTHPDRAAGLGFLGITQTRFGVLFCALGCSFAGHIANSVTHEGASLASFKILIAAFAALCVIVAFVRSCSGRRRWHVFAGQVFGNIQRSAINTPKNSIASGSTSLKHPQSPCWGLAISSRWPIWEIVIKSSRRCRSLRLPRG